MITKKFYEVNGSLERVYSVILSFEGTNLVDAQCDCRHGTLFSGNYVRGEKLCRHIIKIIKEHGNK